MGHATASKERKSFADRLAGALEARGTVACVGIDPVLEKLPTACREGGRAGDAASALEAFSLGVVRAVAGVAPVVKFQSACFERYGGGGVAALERSMAAAREAGLVVILDAKRGDIGVTAEHYAAAAFGHAHTDALTVNAYLGPDTVEPYLTGAAGADKGVFVLVRTSNPGSDAVQSLKLKDGRTVAEMMADVVTTLGMARRGRCGLSDVGAVVGATKPADAKAMRARMPDAVFLVPGYGAQGGGVEEVRPLVRGGAKGPADAGVLVTASRSVIYAFKAEDAGWEKSVRGAAERMVAELGTLF